MWGLQAGARLLISTPENHFGLAHGRPEYLLVAGGIGITPIFTMAAALAREQASFRVLYGFRRRGDAALAEDLQAQLGGRLALYCDADGARLDLGAEIARLHPAGELYVCGPIGLLEAAKRVWRESGRPVDQLRFETFGASGRFASEPFRVRIPRLGLELEVPQNRTLLETLEAAGVEMIYDCRRGECGLCALAVLDVEGEIDHRDVFFNDEQKASNRKLCTCVSRAVGGALTLDTPDRAPP
jgi:vanillate O-demethylase ferredoxin subunit